MKKKLPIFIIAGISSLILASCNLIIDKPSITTTPSTSVKSSTASTSTPSSSTSNESSASSSSGVTSSITPTSTPTFTPSSESKTSTSTSTSSKSTSTTTSSKTSTSTTTSTTVTPSSSTTSNSTTSSSSIVETEISILESGNYGNGVYAIFNKIATLDNLSDYIVKYKKSTSDSYTTIDSNLLRNSSDTSTIRFDIVDLASGTYTIRVEASNSVYTEYSVVVSDYDRSGYAHFNYSNGVGAYNDDGTLKTDAVVVYVSDETKNTVTATINKKTYTGISAIIQAQAKSSVALDIRIIGTINAAQWNKKTYTSTAKSDALIDEMKKDLSYSSWKSSSSCSQDELETLGVNSMSNDINNGITKLNGLSNKIIYKDGEFDSYFNDLDVSTASNITIEGIGNDASIFQWGFTFKKCNSVEVRNLTFSNYTEDALGFEGASDSDINYGNYWVHNCVFNKGVNNWDLTYEQDKSDGDGATDFKRCHNVTLSYNIYNETHKTTLIGANDKCLQYNITIHHNYYNQCKSRLPLLRQANVHLYNNYYYKCSTAQDIRANAFAFSESNYFDNCTTAQKTTTTTTYTSTVIKSYNDYYTSSKNSTTATKVTSRDTTVSGNCLPDGSTNFTNFDTNSTLFYYDSTNKKTNVYNYIEANKVKDYVLKYAGILGGIITTN